MHSNSQKTLKIVLFSVICVFATSLTADIRTPVELTVNSNATVADLMASTVNGHTGFHLPDTPHFRHWYDITSPRSYNAMYELNAGTITLGSFMRFIDQSPKLFSGGQNKAQYRKTLKTAIKAHKNYAARTTKANWKHLQKAEAMVFEQLQKLPVHDSRILKTLEELLSSHYIKKSFLRFIDGLAHAAGKIITSFFILPFRANVKKTPKTETTKEQYTIMRWPLWSMPLVAYGMLFHNIYASSVLCLLIATGKGDPKNNLGPSSLILWGINLAAALFSDIKLAPEPKYGIKVTIKQHQGT